jgi:hypothetical protein
MQARELQRIHARRPVEIVRDSTLDRAVPIAKPDLDVLVAGREVRELPGSVEMIAVRRHGSTHDDLTQSPRGLDHALVRPRHRVAREQHTRRHRLDELLHHRTDTGLGRESPARAVLQCRFRSRRLPHQANGIGQRGVGHVQLRHVLPGEAGVRGIFTDG